jgi:GntR family transcriptional regulator, rspAB operon transcriptional repressor
MPRAKLIEPMMIKLPTATEEPVARRVFKELRAAIVSMRFAPGQALSEKDVADKLGISRQPVREAFIKLQEAGLVSIRPQRGTFVVKISAKQVYDVRFVREAIEVQVARRACEVRTAADLEALDKNLRMQRRLAESHDAGDFLSLDEAFHRLMAQAADCHYAWMVVEDMKAQMDRVRYLSLPQATPLERLVDQHAAILQAIRHQDPAGAEACVRVHMREILTSLPSLEERYPDLFEAGPHLG